MYKLPEHARKVIDLYDNFDWREVVQMPLQNVSLDSNNVELHGEKAITFGNASYLGFHKDPRVINAGISAMQQNGTLYCSTRAFTYMPMHDEFEDLLGQIFGLPTVSTIQTAMASFGAMQLLMLPSDVAIVDTMAHATLQSMLQIPKANGMLVDRIIHNNLDHLETKIKLYQAAGKEKIWYVADSVYSMYGDTAPVKDLVYLLEKYENFYIYFDDAHGMSWAGPNGAGYIWKYLPMGHPKVVMATSLGKGFGIGGGALICPNAEIKSWIRRVGMNLVFCTQLPNQMLGSGIEVAKIHLTNEIYQRQDKLKENIDFFIQTARQYNLPFFDYSETPLFFMIVGKHTLAVELNKRLRYRGYYANLGSYPAVSFKNTGLRISITCDHTKEEIAGLLSNTYHCLMEILQENFMTLEDLILSLEKTKMKVA
jgi:7-keto-8-aminopelargonate synthetase-like enzyme